MKQWVLSGLLTGIWVRVYLQNQKLIRADSVTFQKSSQLHEAHSVSWELNLGCFCWTIFIKENFIGSRVHIWLISISLQSIFSKSKGSSRIICPLLKTFKNYSSMWWNNMSWGSWWEKELPPAQWLPQIRGWDDRWMNSRSLSLTQLRCVRLLDKELVSGCSMIVLNSVRLTSAN